MWKRWFRWSNPASNRRPSWPGQRPAVGSSSPFDFQNRALRPADVPAGHPNIPWGLLRPNWRKGELAPALGAFLAVWLWREWHCLKRFVPRFYCLVTILHLLAEGLLQPVDHCAWENVMGTGRLFLVCFGCWLVSRSLDQQLFRWWLILLAFPIFPAAAATTGEFVCTSGEQQTTLLELFTSEGCNSCPPAEAWLSSLAQSQKLWTEFVPVAFHVDYWDYLGWKDGFALPQFSERQRIYVAAWRQPTMYTPAFVVNGREAGSIGHAQLLERPRATPGLLRVEPNGQNGWVVRFTPAAHATGPYQAQVALLDCGLRVKVTRGENAGRELPHDFVVRLWQTVAMREVDGTALAEITLPTTPLETRSRRGLAVWVTRDSELTPLQATGGWLP